MARICISTQEGSRHAVDGVGAVSVLCAIVVDVLTIEGVVLFRRVEEEIDFPSISFSVGPRSTDRILLELGVDQIGASLEGAVNLLRTDRFVSFVSGVQAE